MPTDADAKMVRPDTLIPGDLVNLEPLLYDFDIPAEDEDWDSVQSEYAWIESVTVTDERWKKETSQRLVLITNNLLNVMVPERHLVALVGHEAFNNVA